MVFRPFYVEKEFLRKIPSLPDFDFRDSDNTQTVILENIIRSSGIFFHFWGVLKDCCGMQDEVKREKNHIAGTNFVFQNILQQTCQSWVKSV